LIPSFRSYQLARMPRRRASCNRLHITEHICYCLLQCIREPDQTPSGCPEVLRLVRALQTSLTNGVATPEAWQPGEKVIVGSPKTMAEVEKRLTEGLETTDWYFTVKDLA